MKEFPTSDMAITTILVVDDIDRSVAWYRDVLGASLFREYGGTSAVFQFNEAWLLVVTGGICFSRYDHRGFKKPIDSPG